MAAFHGSSCFPTLLFLMDHVLLLSFYLRLLGFTGFYLLWDGWTGHPEGGQVHRGTRFHDTPGCQISFDKSVLNPRSVFLLRFLGDRSKWARSVPSHAHVPLTSCEALYHILNYFSLGSFHCTDSISEVPFWFLLVRVL